MDLRGMLFAIMLVALPMSSASTQETADIAGVKAASQAFYAALSVLDDGSAMERIWARTPYVTYVGPQSRAVIVGWDAQKKYWEAFNKLFLRRSVSLENVHIHANGNLAWEIGTETGEAQLADGAARKVDWFVTNIYERIDGRWLLVSHHVQPKPQ